MKVHKLCVYTVININLLAPLTMDQNLIRIFEFLVISNIKFHRQWENDHSSMWENDDSSEFDAYRVVSNK
jgi:hypothetical protein